MAAFGLALVALAPLFALGVWALVAAGTMPADLAPAAAVGFALAAVAVLVGACMHARLGGRTAVERDATLASQRLQALLGGSFVAKLACLGLGYGALRWAGMKFDFLIAFAVAFAAAALALQLVTVARLARQLSARSRAALASLR